MSDALSPDEVAFLAMDPRCAQCGHCAVFHLSTSSCEIAACRCTGFVEPPPASPPGSPDGRPDA